MSAFSLVRTYQITLRHYVLSTCHGFAYFTISVPYEIHHGRLTFYCRKESLTIYIVNHLDACCYGDDNARSIVSLQGVGGGIGIV